MAFRVNDELFMSLSISYGSAVSSPPPVSGLERRPSALHGGRLLQIDTRVVAVVVVVVVVVIVVVYTKTKPIMS